MILGGTLEQLFKFIEVNDDLAIDVETNSKNRRQAVLMGFSITTGNAGFYVCTRVWDPDGYQLLPTENNIHVGAILTALKGKKLRTWNGAYDLPVLLHNTDVDLLPYLHIDGMLLRHTINENEFSYALKDIARAEFGDAASDEQQELKQAVLDAGGRWTKDHKDMYMAPPEILGKYCIKDGILTNRIIDRDLPKLAQQNLGAFFWDDEVMPLYREVTIPMEMRGIAIDLPLIEQTKTELETDISALEAQILSKIEPYLTEFKQWWMNKEYPPSRTGSFAQGICAYFDLQLPKTKAGKYSLTEEAINSLPDSHGKSVLLKQAYMSEQEVEAIQNLLWTQDGKPKLFNLSSKHHLKKLFFETLQEKPLSTTDKGNPQVDDEFLEVMRTKYDWAELLHIYNRLNKILGTYVNRVLEYQEDGRFYASFFQHRTVSGRYAGDLQQLPRKLEPDQDHPLVVKYVNRIRDFYIADDGGVLIDADYESLEPHIFAHVSGDKRIQDIFHRGHDFYSTIAIDTEGLVGVSADKGAPNYLGKVNKAKRQAAKAYSLGIPYGLGGYKLQFELNIPLQQAETLVQGYLDAYPDLAHWMKHSETQALERGYVVTQGGRRRRFPRLQQIFRKYGHVILDDLELWKQFHEMPGVYAQAKKDRRELKNYLNNAKNVQIQGLAASVMNKAMIKMAQEFKQKGMQTQIVASVHDECLLASPAQEAEQAAQIMQQVMENIWKLDVPLKAEPIIGHRYGELK